jgi:hypothetical protein
MLNVLANDSIERGDVIFVTPSSANTPFDIVEHTALLSSKFPSITTSFSYVSILNVDDELLLCFSISYRNAVRDSVESRSNMAPIGIRHGNWGDDPDDAPAARCLWHCSSSVAAANVSSVSAADQAAGGSDVTRKVVADLMVPSTADDK